MILSPTSVTVVTPPVLPPILTGPPSPGTVVVPPGLPPIQTDPPAAGGAVVVPVQGPKGDPGAIDDLDAVQDMIDGSIATHVQAAEPHPAYDEMPSLRLVFENGLI